MKQRNMERTQSESEIEQHRQLEYDDQSHTTRILSQLHKMHKRDQFCDAKLIVGDHETCIHRAVLASASNFFFKMFEKGLEEDKNRAMFKLKDVRWDEFKYLMHYIYTGRLEVPDDEVRAVYRLSQDLRIHSATMACVQYLTSCLTPDNCLGIRMFAADDNFREQVNQYISENIREVTNSKNFYGRRISLEIVVPDEHLVNRASNDEILPQVLLWLKDKVSASKNKVEPLTEHTIVLYLNSDKLLTDCYDVDDEVIQENEVVQDYKQLTRRKQSGKVAQKDSTSTSPETSGTPNYMKFSIEPYRPTHELEWSIVASYKTKDRSYMVIAMLYSNLVTISVHYRPAVSAGSGNDDPESPIHTSTSANSLFDKIGDEEPLKGMSTNRCAFGLKALDGKLFACGGYDRGECLNSSEVYDFESNQWSVAGEMKSARGRFSIAAYDGKIYACGGSNGNQDMRTVECYTPSEDKWQIVAEAPRGKASPGIAVLHGKLYVLGGCIGQSTVSTCEMLDLETNQWKGIAPMRLKRFQVAVTVFRNKIYAIGGTSGWKCLNEVEMYDPQTDEWSLLPHLNICRRGAGVEVYTGKIWIIGGNDGTSALSSTEIYDPETHTWSLGPTLNSFRANCGVAVLDDRLFAAGGFNGKKFLNSVEYLNLGRTEYWSSNMPDVENGGSDDVINETGDIYTNNDVINDNDDSSTKNDAVIHENGGSSAEIDDCINENGGSHAKIDHDINENGINYAKSDGGSSNKSETVISGDSKGTIVVSPAGSEPSGKGTMVVSPTGLEPSSKGTMVVSPTGLEPSSKGTMLVSPTGSEPSCNGHVKQDAKSYGNIDS